MGWTLAAGIALDLLTAAFSLYAALRVRTAWQRGIPVRSTMPFWYGLAGFLLLDGGYALLVLAVEVPQPVPLLVLMARRLLFLIGTGALVLALLQMARMPLRPYVFGYYVALITAIEALTLWQNPATHIELPWSIQFVYRNESPELVNFAVGVAIFAPLALASILALLRYRVQATRDQRFRLVAFTSSVLSFCVGVVIGFWDNDWFWYGLFENRLALAVVAGMLVALRPPWPATRWGVAKRTMPEHWPQ